MGQRQPRVRRSRRGPPSLYVAQTATASEQRHRTPRMLVKECTAMRASAEREAAMARERRPKKTIRTVAFECCSRQTALSQRPAIRRAVRSRSRGVTSGHCGAGDAGVVRASFDAI